MIELLAFLIFLHMSFSIVSYTIMRGELRKIRKIMETQMTEALDRYLQQCDEDDRNRQRKLSEWSEWTCQRCGCFLPDDDSPCDCNELEDDDIPF